MKKESKKRFLAFTIAELLTVFALLGFVSTVTLRSVVTSVNNEKMNVQQTVLNNELAVSLADMHADGTLVGYDSEDDFTDKFKDYFGVQDEIINKSSSANSDKSGTTDGFDDFATKNFNTSYTDEDGNIVKPSNYDTVFKTSKGASVALTYNKNCQITSKFVKDQSGSYSNGSTYGYKARNQALACVEGFYDVNGKAGPNKFGFDVGYISKISGDCDGNYLMGSDGKCSVCSLTSANCKASNKTLNKNSCTCECTKTCPKNLTLNTSTCTCECANKTDYNKAYCRWDDTSCSPIPINFLTPAKCKAAGGHWDAATCNCDCSDVASACTTNSYGYAETDVDDYCACKCKYSSDTSEFKTQLTTNAKKGGMSDISNVSNYTTSANAGQVVSSSLKCFKCKEPSDSKFVYTEQQGYCQKECNGATEKATACKKNEDFFTWSEDTCECSCNTTKLNQKLSDLNASLVSEQVVNTSGIDAQVWGYILPTAASCARGQCSSYKSCAQGCFSSNVATNAITQALIRAYNNGAKLKTSADISNYGAQYVLDSNNCYFSFKNAFSDKSNLVKDVYFHCAAGECKAYHIGYGSKTKAFENPNEGRPSGTGKDGDSSDWVTGANNKWTRDIGVKVTNLWNEYDPIVLSYYDSKTAEVPSTTSSNVNFKLECAKYNGAKTKCISYNDVSTPWIKTGTTNSNNTHLFLVTLDSSKKVPNISYMFSDVKINPSNPGTAYTTGLEQLEDEFATKDNNGNGYSSCSSSDLSDECHLINSLDDNFNKLYVWWDKDMDAVVDDGEIFSLSDKNIVEINTNPHYVTTTSGTDLETDTMKYSITGEYIRLIKADNIGYKCTATPYNNSRRLWQAADNSACGLYSGKILYLKPLGTDGKYNHTFYATDTENCTKNSEGYTSGYCPTNQKLNISVTRIQKINGISYREIVDGLTDVIFKATED